MGKKKGKGRRCDIWYLRFRHAEGFEEPVGSIGLRESVWHIRYFSSEGQEVEESANTEDKDAAALFLLCRSQEQRRKLDAEVLVAARNRLKDLSDPETRHFVSHGLFHTLLDATTPRSHKVLHGAIAPLDWWEGEGKEYIPPLGFGCACALIGITERDARRRTERGEGYDVTRGLPSEAKPDPQWQQWAAALEKAWADALGRGLGEKEAIQSALAQACSTIATDPQATLAAFVWSQ